MPQGMLNRITVVAGRLTVHELKDADCTAYTLVGGGISPSAVRHPHPGPCSNVHVSSGPILAAAGVHGPESP